MENTVRLNNGVEMPRIGYGVYQIPSLATERCVREALSVGYRSVDTAQCYGNERAVGKGVSQGRKSSSPRSSGAGVGIRIRSSQSRIPCRRWGWTISIFY